MTLKLNRDYKLTISGDDINVTIVPPLKIAFEATKSIEGRALNKMNLQIYNLNQKNRNKIVRDPEQRDIIKVVLQVGYEGSLSTVYVGSVYRAFIDKQGNNIVNVVQSLDGAIGFAQGYVNKSVDNKADALKEITDQMMDVALGKITQQETTSRPIVMVGNAGRMLNKHVDPNMTWYINDGFLNVTNKKEYIGKNVPVVSGETGLENTPSRENTLVTFETLMNPSLVAGGLCKIVSASAVNLNGVYIIEQITFKGDSHGNDWRQTVTCRVAQEYTKL